MKKGTAYRPYGGKHRLWPKLLAGVLGLGLLTFLTLEAVVLAGSRTHIEGEPKTMIILGCQVMPWGPSVLLTDRLDAALFYLEGREDVRVVVSGGQGSNEPTTEAKAMKDYLVRKGIDASRILMEDKSHNTHQNLSYSLTLLKEEGADLSGGYIIVSNGFHLARSAMLARRLDGESQVYTLSAPSSHGPSRIKMYFREPLALVKSFLLDR